MSEEDGVKFASGFVRKTNPFVGLRIADNSFLATVTERHPCPKCNASRKFFCYTCYVCLPDVPAFPEVEVKNLYKIPEDILI